MFSNFFKNKFYSDSFSQSNDTHNNSDSNKFEKLLYQENDVLHKEIIRAYANYMISYTPRAFKSNTYEKLKSSFEYYKDFDANVLKPYSLEEFAFKFHKKEIIANTSNDFKKGIIVNKSLNENDSAINNIKNSTSETTSSITNDNKNLDIKNKIDYTQYKKLLIESKRSHFLNCIVQLLFLNNYPTFISK